MHGWVGAGPISLTRHDDTPVSGLGLGVFDTNVGFGVRILVLGLGLGLEGQPGARGMVPVLPITALQPCSRHVEHCLRVGAGLGVGAGAGVGVGAQAVAQREGVKHANSDAGWRFGRRDR